MQTFISRSRSVLFVSLLFSSLTVAAQAPPVNDDINNATVIPFIDPPFTDSLDTTHATTGFHVPGDDTTFDDPDCVGNGPTVWYQFWTGAATPVEFNTFGSDYDTTISVYTGVPGNLFQIACNDDARGTLQSRVRFDAEAGETYFVMVGAFASGPGGQLEFTAQVAAPIVPLEFDISVDSRGAVVASRGVVTIQGTVRCSTEAFVSFDGTLTQRAGRSTITSFFFDFVLCDGLTPFAVTLEGLNGRFAGGKAKLSLNAFASTPDSDQFDFRHVAAEIQLRGGGPR